MSNTNRTAEFTGYPEHREQSGIAKRLESRGAPPSAGEWLTVGHMDVADYVASCVADRGWELRYHCPEFAVIRTDDGGFNLLQYGFRHGPERPGSGWLSIPYKRAALLAFLRAHEVPKAHALVYGPSDPEGDA